MLSLGKMRIHGWIYVLLWLKDVSVGDLNISNYERSFWLLDREVEQRPRQLGSYSEGPGLTRGIMAGFIKNG